MDSEPRPNPANREQNQRDADDCKGNLVGRQNYP
jgi:hypothetical protein